MSLSWNALHAQMLQQVRTKCFHAEFRALRAAAPDLAVFADHASLLTYLHASDGTAEARDQVLHTLVGQAQSGAGHADAAKLVLMLALWPGCDAIHGRLIRHFRSEPAALAAEISGRLAGEIARLQLDWVNRIAATIVRNIERDIRRFLNAEWTAQTGRAHVDPDTVRPDDALVIADCDPRLLLRRLCAMIPEDAPLVALVVICGLSQKEAAAHLGISHDAARKRYQRALARLRKAHSDFF